MLIQMKTLKLTSFFNSAWITVLCEENWVSSPSLAVVDTSLCESDHLIWFVVSNHLNF